MNNDFQTLQDRADEALPRHCFLCGAPASVGYFFPFSKPSIRAATPPGLVLGAMVRLCAVCAARDDLGGLVGAKVTGQANAWPEMTD